jgi:hypothetical protein
MEKGRAFAGAAARNYTIRMSRRLSILLAVAGMALICLSCSAIAYALWPIGSIRERIELLPYWFSLP